LIDWYEGQILSFQMPLQKVSKPTLIGLWLPELQPTDLPPQLKSPLTRLLLSELQPIDSVLLQPESPLSNPVLSEVEQPKSSVSFINAAAYVHPVCTEGLVSFQLSLFNLFLLGQSTTTTSAEPDLTGVLEEYHEFADIFS